VDRAAATIPVAVQQKYLSEAVEQSLEQIDFGRLQGKDVFVTVVGVLQMSDQEFGDYLAKSVETKIALAGGRVVPQSKVGQLVVRVGEAGLDSVTEYRSRRNKNRGPTLVVVGSVLTLSVFGSPVGIPLLIWGVNDLTRKPLPAQVYHMRVSMTVTWIPTSGEAWEDRGGSDLVLSDAIR